jgi:F-type H+-transporting ATPase subunit gamma
MPNLKLLVKRRKSIRNIRKITRTMELIATARFKKALDRASEADAYTKKIAELAADLSSNAGEVSHPLLAVRKEIKKVLVLVLTSNRGLCGGYNGTILREAQNRLKGLKAAGTPFDLDVSGRRGQTFFKFQRYDIGNAYQQFEDKPTFEQVDAIATKYADMYASGQIDQLIVVYQKFINAAKQTPASETLLPMSSPAAAMTVASDAAKKVGYEFLPSATEILNSLVPVAFKVRLFKCFLDAAVSEQIARRVAMKAATENAGDLIKSISQVYNRTRQANITKEISELIGGSEALK